MAAAAEPEATTGTNAVASANRIRQAAADSTVTASQGSTVFPNGNRKASRTVVPSSMTPTVGSATPTPTAPATITSGVTPTVPSEPIESPGGEIGPVGAAAGPTLRINSAGGAYTDTAGRLWAADSNFSGGATSVRTNPIAGTTDDPLYQSHRWGNFSYNFPVTNGSYSVTLKFAETYWDTPGQRVFDVRIEGQLVLDNFDILAQVPKNTALDRTFATSVSDGTLTIQFTRVVDYASIAAIEIVETSATRVNAGGGAYTDGAGNVWAADTRFSGGSTATRANAIAGTTDDPLYQSERYGNFGYQFPTGPGTYTVTLKFAEFYWSSAGQRVFDVLLEGQLVLDNFDIVQAAGGPNRAVDRTFTATVTGNNLDIEFRTVVDNAKVSAIEILREGSGPIPTPPSTSTPPPAPPPSSVPDPAPVSLQSLVNNASAGSTVSVPPGIYRQTVTINKPLTLVAEPGAEIRGSDVFTDWNPQAGRWVSVRTVPGLPGIGSDSCGGGRCAWPEQVFLDGQPLVQVASNPGPGQFALDGGRRVVLGEDPSWRTVEVTTRTRWVIGQANNVTIRGFTMQHAATDALGGGISIGGSNSNWTIEDNRLLHAHGGVLDGGGWPHTGRGHRILRNEIAYGGGVGIINTGHNALVQGNDIHHNGTEGFNCGWGCAGLKATQTGITLDGNEVHDNQGAGLHLDAYANDATIINNRVYSNRDMGIQYEVSEGARITDNVLWKNGNLNQGWAWGAGIVLSTAANVEVARNVVAWNVNGITVVSQPRPDVPDVRDIWVHDNTIIHWDPPSSCTGWCYAYALAWAQEDPGVMYDWSSNNRGENNKFWAPPEGPYRFDWNGSFSQIAAFANTPGGQGARYISMSERDQILNGLGLPTQP